jgi:uncharacterized damage-inducible protein DinB
MTAAASPSLADQLLDTWHINNRIHLFLLEALSPDALRGQLSSGGRDVAHQFAHAHDVRLMWLKAAAPDLLSGLDKLGSVAAPDHTQLAGALEASSDAMATLIARGLETGRIKSFKPHLTAFVGYLVAHESYHRAEICLALTQSGHALPAKIAYGLWEWGSR